MKYKNILITGGAGFVGSNLCLKLRENYPEANVVALDNLKRRGSELNIPRLIEGGIKFVHGDIRNKEDLESLQQVDLVLECSAEPSVMAGVSSSPEYLVNTNLVGTINCLELSRKNKADFIFLSTSRVYPIEEINQLKFKEADSRFVLNNKQTVVGSSGKGIDENFPLGKSRSLYGATKLASELLIQEYVHNYGIKAVINRCGVITGPWQMGKIDQGVFVLWVAHHIFKKPLSYIGYGGTGKQVRDFVHIDDLFELINLQIQDLYKFNNEVYNVGGGIKNSVSLLELTKCCEKITGNKIKISSVAENRPNDIRVYISNCEKIRTITNWKPRRNLEYTISDIVTWINNHRDKLSSVLN